MANVLIAGCGYTGTKLGTSLSEDGHTVWGLRRNPDSLPSSIQPIEGDLTQPSTLTDVPESIDYLVYTASASGRGKSAYLPIYVKGLKNLIQKVRNREIKHLLYTSSTAVYGQKNGEWVDETSSTEPDRDRGQILLEAEQIVQSQSYPGTVLRLGGIYGPGRERYIEMVQSGRATCYEGSPHYTNKNHVADIVGALKHLMHQPDLAGVYNGTDGNPTDRCKILRWLADRLDAPEPEVEPLENASDRIRATNKRIRNEKLKQTGYEFTYPSFREGYQELIRAHR